MCFRTHYLWGIIRDMPSPSLYTFQKLSSWGFCSLQHLVMPVHSNLGLPSVHQCYRVHAVKSAEKRLSIQSFTNVRSLHTIHNGHPLKTLPHGSHVHPTGVSMLLSTSCIFCITAAVSVYLFLMARISDWSVLASVSSISRIPVLGCPSFQCTLKFTVCFFFLHSTAHNHGWAANFTNGTFAKCDLAVNTLHEVKPVKTTLPNACFVHIPKSSQDLV
jgi:hypothetical protein